MKNIVILGSTGSGKSRLLCMPMIGIMANAGESFIVTDPKEELFKMTRFTEDESVMRFAHKLKKMGVEDKLEELLFAFVEKTTRTLRSKKQYAKTIAVIFKNNKFETYSAQEKLERPSNNITEIYKLAISIFRKK